MYSNVAQGLGHRNVLSPRSSFEFLLEEERAYSYSGLKAVIRAPSRPPCTGTLEWFESGPDIPEEIAAQTPNSSQSATNSRIAALPLKIERDGELGVWRGPAWMEDE